MDFVERGGGGGQTPNINFWYFILVELLNLVTEKCNPIFGLNSGGRGQSWKKLHALHAMRVDILPRIKHF